jgi:hypothetical protein
MMTPFMGLGVREPIGSEWWSSFSPALRDACAAWINAARVRGGLAELRTPTDDRLRSYDRSAADGGGFVVGSACLCPASASGGVTQQIASDRMCPAGTGGVGGTVTRELTVDEMRAEAARLNEEARRKRTAGDSGLGPLDLGPLPKPETESSTGLIIGGVVVAALLAWLALK